MHSADSGGLHTNVHLVGLHRDVQIEQYLALKIQLERRLGTVIAVVRVSIVMQHTDVRIFHLHRFIAAQT